MGRTWGIVAAVGGLANLIILIISLATAVWVVTTEDSGVNRSVGLWQACVSAGCVNLNNGK